MTDQLPATLGHSQAHAVPVLVAAAGERAGMRSLEFFAANIRNAHTRRAYAGAPVLREHRIICSAGKPLHSVSSAGKNPSQSIMRRIIGIPTS
jgi:hypothetical protein